MVFNRKIRIRARAKVSRARCIRGNGLNSKNCKVNELSKTAVWRGPRAQIRTVQTAQLVYFRMCCNQRRYRQYAIIWLSQVVRLRATKVQKILRHRAIGFKASQTAFDQNKRLNFKIWSLCESGKKTHLKRYTVGRNSHKGGRNVKCIRLPLDAAR